MQSAFVLYGRKVTLILSGDGSGDFVEASGILDNNGNALDPEYDSVEVDSLLVNPHLVGNFNYWDPSNHDYDLTLNNLSSAKAAIFDFFDNVVVNDNDKTIRKNRLELLQMLCKTFENYINFSKIESV